MGKLFASLLYGLADLFILLALARALGLAKARFSVVWRSRAGFIAS